MSFDFSTITIYEFLALGLSFIAIIIPAAKWMWGKFCVKAVLRHYTLGRASLYIGNAGSSIRIDSVYEVCKKTILVRNITLKVIRTKDERVINLH